jgi:hypothetical protein
VSASTESALPRRWHAIAACQRDLTMLDDGHRHPRHAGQLHGPAHASISRGGSAKAGIAMKKRNAVNPAARALNIVPFLLP